MVIRLVAVYRPPYNWPDWKWTVTDFLKEFSTYMESVLHTAGHLLIVGDFNIHVDDSTDCEAAKFTDLIFSLGLKQHVQEPTHEKGHLRTS